MSRKNTLNAVKDVTSGDMSAASVTSLVTDIQYLDNISVQLSWTSSPVGTFAIQGSLDYSPGDAASAAGRTANAGTWTPITLTYLSGSVFVSATSIPTSVGSPILLNLSNLSFPYIRVVYTRSSGSGTLTSWIMGKAI